MSDPAPTPPPRWLVLGLAALTLVVVAALSLVLFRDDIDTSSSVAEPATVDEVLVADAFDRPDADSLADADHAWTQPRGGWAVRDGHAALVTPTTPDGPNLAVLPTDSADGVASVSATAVEPGWGFAFRAQDADDYWALVARPETSTWSLVLVQAGVVTETTDFLAREPVDGTHIEVRLAGDAIEVTLDGTLSNQVTDATFADATGLGLVALTGENAASMAWDDVGLRRR